MNKHIILTLAALVIFGAACQKKPVNTTNTQNTNSNSQNTNQTVSNTNQSTTSSVLWDNSADGWMAFGTPPACPTPFTVTTPVDLTKVTSILYPGQSRPDYKPHGGFRFDTAPDTSIAYTSPIDGEVIRGAQFLANGQIQYTFDIVHPCGMMVRLGHLLELTPKFQAITAMFPAATEGDSRTTRVQPPIQVTAGEQVATKVGLSVPTKNVFADFGMYDLRAKNVKSQDTVWAASHDKELAQHAVCWFDHLSTADEATVRSLPAGDPTAGKTSDFCL